MTETIAGIVAGVLIILIYHLLSRYITARFFCATIIVAIAFIYVGFSLKENPVSAIALECIVALAFYFLAVIGYIRNYQLIATGILLHGVWDIFHHQGVFISTDVPGYWPTFCFTIDIIDGLYFLYLIRNQQKSGSAESIHYTNQ